MPAAKAASKVCESFVIIVLAFFGAGAHFNRAQHLVEGNRSISKVVGKLEHNHVVVTLVSPNPPNLLIVNHGQAQEQRAS